MLDEKALRRPEWSEGEWIKLGDGGQWCLPKPTLREFRPVFSPDGGAKFAGASLKTFGAGHLSRLDDLLDTEPGVEQIEKVAALGADLIRRNYDLDDEQLGTLLPYVITEAGDLEEECHDMWQSICNVAAGVGRPKPIPSGSASE